ncbi:MAG: anhydro-N-acetylmuramic acid kinase, partial [Candidatus Poribacteria bacterium]
MADWLSPLAAGAAREAGVYVGLMSGTSADGIDVAVVELIDGESPRELAFHSAPYSVSLRERVLRAIAGEAGPAEINQLHAVVGEAFGQATKMILDAGGMRPADMVAIGSHGQTVWHQPPTKTAPRGATLQLGNPAVIAARAGIPVVSDFRSADMAQGGEGAPLAPYLDWMVFSHPTKRRALQNIGGIANVTFLPTGSEPAAVIAFDTGPGNALMDVAVAEVSGGELSMDIDGSMAAAGTPNETLLAAWMREPYLQRRPPKSTGREHFGKAYALRCVEEGGRAGCVGVDLVATLTEFTARSIADAYATFFPAPPDEIIVSGGGKLNPTLMRALRAALDARGIIAPFCASEDWGVGAESKEAVAFAVLA